MIDRREERAADFTAKFGRLSPTTQGNLTLTCQHEAWHANTALGLANGAGVCVHPEPDMRPSSVCSLPYCLGNSKWACKCGEASSKCIFLVFFLFLFLSWNMSSHFIVSHLCTVEHSMYHWAIRQGQNCIYVMTQSITRWLTLQHSLFIHQRGLIVYITFVNMFRYFDCNHQLKSIFCSIGIYWINVFQVD